jgi:hypothetical protein
MSEESKAVVNAINAVKEKLGWTNLLLYWIAFSLFMIGLNTCSSSSSKDILLRVEIQGVKSELHGIKEAIKNQKPTVIHEIRNDKVENQESR